MTRVPAPDEPVDVLPVEPAAPRPLIVVGGIDTHKDLHVAAVIDDRENVLGTRSFSTTRAGYRALVRWMRTHGQVRKVGIEGTGSYGAGITRHLADVDIPVVEVDRPDRSDRRRKGKDDDLDAISAARAALRGQRTSTPKSKDGKVESLRVLRVVRGTGVKSRRVALQMLRTQIVSAPEELRDQVRNLTRMQLIRTCAAWRPDSTDAADPVTATRIALKSLARRILELGDEIAMLDELIHPLVTDLAPQLLERNGIGVEVAGQLLVTAGDNPERLRSEAAFAMLCGVAPLPASSGKNQRHRLNRGGDRQANSALHMAVIVRIRNDPQTKAYLAKRTALGHSKLETIRCLKRYLSREVYYLLKPGTPQQRSPKPPAGAATKRAA
jgi:transposase